MIVAVARKELTELVRDGRMRGAALLFMALLTVALAAGWHAARQIETRNATASAAERERWINQGERWAHSAAHYGIYAFRPAGALAPLDPGIGPYVGTSVWLEAHWQNEAIHRPVQDATFVERFGSLSTAVVLEVCLPLLVILFGFGSIAAERESGTLKLALAQGVSLRALALGKAAAVFLAAAAVTLPLLILGWIVSVATIPSMPWSSGGRLVFWLCGFVAYLGLFTLLSVALSMVTPGPRFALALLLALWMAWCVVLPRAILELATVVQPTPSRQSLAQTVREELHDVEGVERVDELKARLLKEYEVARVEDLPVNWSAINLQESEERGNAIFDKYVGSLYGALHTQIRFAAWVGLVAPPLAFRLLSSGIAGTDLAHHRAFVNAAEAHRREMQRLLNGELAKHPERDNKRHLSDGRLWRATPDFQYQTPSLRYALGATRTPWIGLAVWLTIAAVLFVVASRSREV